MGLVDPPASPPLPPSVALSCARICGAALGVLSFCVYVSPSLPPPSLRLMYGRSRSHVREPFETAGNGCLVRVFSSRKIFLIPIYCDLETTRHNEEACQPELPQPRSRIIVQRSHIRMIQSSSCQRTSTGIIIIITLNDRGTTTGHPRAHQQSCRARHDASSLPPRLLSGVAHVCRRCTGTAAREADTCRKSRQSQLTGHRR